MLKKYTILIISLVIIICSVSCKNIIETTTQIITVVNTETYINTILNTETKIVTETVTETINITQKPLIYGKGAITGTVYWGDKPAVGAEVVVCNQNMAYYNFNLDYKYFYTNTDDNGNYFIMLDPGTYYLGCRINNTTITISSLFNGIMSGVDVSEGEVSSRNVSGIDWSIELISPGNSWSYEDDYQTVNSTPLLLWQYNEDLYGEDLNYIVTLYNYGIYDSTSYEKKIELNSENQYYQIIESLRAGKYKWEVDAYTKSGEEVAGTTIEYYFIIN